MSGARNTLIRCGLEQYWLLPSLARGIARLGWRQLVYDAVDTVSDEVRTTRLATFPSVRDYIDIKEWGRNTENYSFSTGEVGRRCQHVPERYLDDRDDLKGTRLKLLCRIGSLPVMDKVGRELKPPWPKDCRVCYVCNTGVIEDVDPNMRTSGRTFLVELQIFFIIPAAISRAMSLPICPAVPRVISCWASVLETLKLKTRSTI